MHFYASFSDMIDGMEELVALNEHGVVDMAEAFVFGVGRVFGEEECAAGQCESCGMFGFTGPEPRPGFVGFAIGHEQEDIAIEPCSDADIADNEDQFADAL